MINNGPLEPYRQRWIRRGHRWNRYLLLSLIWLPGIIGCEPTRTAEAEEDSDLSFAVPVRVAQVQRTTLRPSIDLVGMVVAVPERTAVIASQIEGRIGTVSVVEGMTVKSGQALIQLDERQAKAELQRANAVVATQQAVLDRLENGYRPQEIEIAKQDMQRAMAELESLRLRVDATGKLRADNEVSEVEFKKLEAAVRANEAAYAAAEAKLDLYEVGTRHEVITEAQAQLDVVKAEQVRARLAVDFCTVPSPFGGVVTQLSARQGMHVARSDRLATVIDLSQVFVRIRVPSGYLSSIRQDARVEVSIPPLREQSFVGKVARFSGEADPNTGDVLAYAILHNGNGLLRPGLACRVRVWLPSIEQALVVPVSALADLEGSSVLHVVRENKAYEVQVSIGASTREYVQITEGLSSDDLVITEGGYGLPEGCPVETRTP